MNNELQLFSSVEDMMRDVEYKWKNRHWLERFLLKFKWRIIDVVWDWISPVMNYNRLIWFWQRLTRGFDDRVIWNLDYKIAEFVLPRLKLFKKKKMGWSNDFHDLNYDDYNEEERKKSDEKAEKEWNKTIDKMIYSFELIIKDEWKSIEEMKKKDKDIEEGLKLFAKYFRELWF
jgi:hypothetical protein